MMFPMRNLLSVSFVTALAGCSLTPLYERPTAPTGAAYPSGSAYAPAADTVGSPVAADIGWRDFFADPLLQRLIELALANNRDLRVTALNVDAARAQYRIQRANLAPAIGVAEAMTRAWRPRWI
jgi:multidrug efflux system outer membrane protein